MSGLLGRKPVAKYLIDSVLGDASAVIDDLDIKPPGVGVISQLQRAGRRDRRQRLDRVAHQVGKNLQRRLLVERDLARIFDGDRDLNREVLDVDAKQGQRAV